RRTALFTQGALRGALAHEQPTPLPGVRVELESLEMAPLAASVREKLLAARAGTARMREVLIARRQGARFAGGELREVMLCHEIDLALTLVAQRMRAAGVALERQYAPDVPLVSCQPTLLGQVLVNLLINALDAMHQQQHARLIVRVRADGAFAFVEVEDSGPGIPRSE